jgi:outer membrane protein TolC
MIPARCQDRVRKLYPLFVLAAVGFAAACSALAAEPAPALTMDAYLSQVDSRSRDLQAAREASEGASLRSSESKLVTSPLFSAEAQWINDQKTNSLFPAAYREVNSKLYSIGLSQQTSFGLKGKLSYTLTNYEYVGNQPPFWEGLPRLELSQSLLRNGFGSETRAQMELLEAGALATKYSESYRAKAIRAEAEGAYVRLATARELRDVLTRSLQRADQILGWNNRRFRMNLGESSDLYQAQANLESVKLQLQQAIDSERTASRDFNRLRNVDADEVPETVDLPEQASVPQLARGQYRDDVRAAIENTRVAAANAALGGERNRSELEIFGSYALNSRESSAKRAIDESIGSDIPTRAIGVRFQTPLAFGTKSDVSKGYAKEKIAAETLRDQKVFEQDIEWKNLVLKLDEAKKRYEISKRLVDVQRKKAETERTRLQRGRTTTYQTLLFDQDLNLAEAGRIQTKGEILQILAQMRTYE